MPQEPTTQEPTTQEPTLKDDVQQLKARLADLEKQVNQLTKVEHFSETQLLDALKAAKPGDRLDFGDVSQSQMYAAVFKLSDPSGPQTETDEQRTANVARISRNLSEHVWTRTYWWGIRIDMDHEAMLALAGGGQAVVDLLGVLGVTAWIGWIIAGVIGIWSAFDRGNGVTFFVTWSGVHWFTPR